MLPAARTFRLAAGFLRFNCGNGFWEKNGALERPQTLRCSKTKKNLSSEDAQSERGTHSKSSRHKKGSYADFRAAASCIL
jgi:hypothetical protein